MRGLMVLPLLLTAVAATDFFHEIMSDMTCKHQGMTYQPGEEWHWDKYPAEDTCAKCQCLPIPTDGNARVYCRKSGAPPALPGCAVYQDPNNCSRFPMVCPSLGINADLDTNQLIGPL